MTINWTDVFTGTVTGFVVGLIIFWTVKLVRLVRARRLQRKQQ